MGPGLAWLEIKGIKESFVFGYNNKIYAIDPIPMVGDYLYDFYFSIFTNSNIFKDLDVDYILSFFDDRDYEYKRALMIICFFIRLRRSSKYDP